MANSETINWENGFDKKELFKLRLKGNIPQFGYISSSKRARFVQFLRDNGFITYKAMFQDLVKMANNSNPGPKVKGTERYTVLYEVEYSFKFEEIGAGSPYRANERVLIKGHRVVTDKSHKLLDMGPGQTY